MTSSPSAEYAVERLTANTLEHFRYWSSLLKLDNGQVWELEEFQCDILAEVFAGYREVVAVLPTGSYKTTTFGGLGLYHCQFVDSGRVPVGAAAKDQAGILFDQAAGFVRRSKHLQKRFKVLEGRKIIRCPQMGSRLQVYAASEDTGDGIIPTLPLLDELHRHKGHNLYGTWRDKLTKTDGTMVVLSTAGDSEDNPLEQLREAAHRLPDVRTGRTPRHTIARSHGREFVMHEYALRAKDDPDDLQLVKQANPASQVTIEELRMRRDSPSTKRWQWLRFTCNVRSKGEDSAIQPEEWDGRGEPGLQPDRAAPTLGWLDLGWKIDHSALGALVWESDERRVICDVTTLPPLVREVDVVVGLLWLQIRFEDLRGIVFDPNAGAQQMAQQLENGEHLLQVDDNARLEYGLPPLDEAPADPLEFIEHSQDNAPMSEAAARFDEALRNEWIVHDAGRECRNGCRCGGLRGHVLNAVSKPLGGDRWKYDRPSDAKGEKRGKYPIDSLTGVLMGHDIGVEELLGGGGKGPLVAWR